MWVEKDEKQSVFFLPALPILGQSLFFRNWLIKKNTGRADDRVELLDVNPRLFAYYIWCSQGGEFQVDEKETPPSNEYNIFNRLYAFAERMQDSVGKEKAIDAVLARYRKLDFKGERTTPDADRVNYVYRATPGPCGMRRLMVDIYAWELPPDWTESPMGDDRFPRLFSREVMDRVVEMWVGKEADATRLLMCLPSHYYD